MNRHYTYRFLYAALSFLSISLLGFIYFIKPMQRDFQLAIAREAELKKELTTLQSVFKKNNTGRSFFTNTAKPTQHLSSLLSALQAEGLIVLQLKPLDNVFHLKIKGDYFALMRFLAVLTPPWMLGDFTLSKNEATTMLLSADFILLQKTWIQKEERLKSTQMLTFPFCRGQLAENLATVSVSQFKMVGFISQGSHKIALLRLPDFSVISVEEGMSLGKEKATLIAISPQGMTLRLPDHTIAQIAMSSLNKE